MLITCKVKEYKYINMRQELREKAKNNKNLKWEVKYLQLVKGERTLIECLQIQPLSDLFNTRLYVIFFWPVQIANKTGNIRIT